MMGKLKFIPGVLIAILILTQLAAGQTGRSLVTFDRNKIIKAKKLSNVRVIAKLDNKAIGLITPDNFAELWQVNESARIIERNINIELLWIEDRKPGVPPSDRVLFETENFRLLKLNYYEARELMASGRRLAKCFDIDLPPDRPFEILTDHGLPDILLDEIDSLIALVSADTIRTYLQRLQDFQTRYTCTDSFWEAGEWITRKFESWGIDSIASELFYAPFPGCDSRNIVGTRFGEAYPDRVIVVGGHYDSVVYDGGDPWVFAPGVDDNATGTVLAMEIARVLADTPFRKTVRFVPFGAEEQGLFGSEHYVEQALLRNEHIEVMFNADMIGNVADTYLDFNILCNPGGFPYGEILRDMANEYTALIPMLRIGESSGSDHYYFGLAGFRTVYSYEGDFSPHWHMQTDIIDNIDVDYVADVIRANLGTLLIALSIPSPVTGLEAFNAGDGETVYLQWDPHPEGEIIGYEVYVGTSELNISIYDTSYTAADTIYNLDEGTPYYFAVSGYTADGTHSLIDEIVLLTPHSVPARPDTLEVVPEFEQLRILWTESPEFDFDYYQLYRRIGEEGDYQPYQQIPENPEFVDDDLQSNIRYYYYVTVFDTTGLESDPSNSDYAKIISFDSGILLVDETRDMGTPNAAQQDSFFNYISEGYPVTRHNIATEGFLSIKDIGPYSTIVWIDDDPSEQKLADIDNDLAGYLDAGGNLFFAGWRSVYSYGGTRPLSFNQGDFLYDYLGINSVNSANNNDFTGANGFDGWPDLSVDTTRTLFSNYLSWVDVCDIQSSPIFTYNSFSGDTTFQDKAVGMYGFTFPINLIFLTFPLYPIGNDPAREIFTMAMDIFEEQTGVSPEQTGEEILPALTHFQNYPNPFNAVTTFSFNLSEKSKVSLDIYNLLGQRITTLVNEKLESGKHVKTWNAHNYSSGIYFYKLTVGDKVITKRMTLLK